jgi:hypothetical protein
MSESDSPNSIDGIPLNKALGASQATEGHRRYRDAPRAGR